MAFVGIKPKRNKTEIDNTILKLLGIFTYLACKTSYRGEDTDTKITKFLQILGLPNNILKSNLVQRIFR
jgi:hypothetical protein